MITIWNSTPRLFNSLICIWQRPTYLSGVACHSKRPQFWPVSPSYGTSLSKITNIIQIMYVKWLCVRCVVLFDWHSETGWQHKAKLFIQLYFCCQSDLVRRPSFPWIIEWTPYRYRVVLKFKMLSTWDRLSTDLKSSIINWRFIYCWTICGLVQLERSRSIKIEIGLGIFKDQTID